ncbi:polysaccharide biosynthesis protein [Marinicellulosiphila megalodicopiae]|uniref:polysaccharide biosynthesis protein n=1 Tax=Marinicellulosiphila megalodicopiae TaxID=2724896 RepID=UPI003BAEE185
MFLISRIFEFSRFSKRLISLCIDSVFIFISFWGAFYFRLDNVDIFSESEYWYLFTTILIISALSFARLGLYRAVLRFINSQALWAVVAGVVISTFCLITLSFYFEITLPRSVPLIYFCFSILLVGGSRLTVRALVERGNNYNKEPILIYGAGSAGVQLATALTQGPEYHVVAFVDDERAKQGTVIKGIRVYSPAEIENIIKTKKVKKVSLALPSATRSRRKEILLSLESLPIGVFTIPGISELVDGSAKVSEFKEVGIEDLLGRDAVVPKQNLMTANITDKVVLVTGAGGSIGSELCRQIILQKPSKLVLFELSEFALYSIEKELNSINLDKHLEIEILPVMGSVQKENRLETVYQSFNVQTVYHAAAYKHVPLVELNVVEGVRNNIFGTLYAAKAAISAGVEKFVLISTDKAVRPTNIMGTTKRMAELVLQSLAKEQSKTNFTMVRFGNVLGSSGSVVPLFRKQIKEGGPVTLTHPDITRFFMTIPEAAQLVIQAGAMGKGGDVFVLDMGQSVKIKDLAEKMIKLSGFTLKSDTNPLGDIAIECTGLRPGEKLYEELLIGDDVIGTSHERIMTANEVMLDWKALEKILVKLDKACHEFNHEKIRELLLEAPTAFNPKDGICDLVWTANKQ